MITLATSPLVKMLYSSLLASVSTAVVFSLVVLGATRASELRRADRHRAATAYAALAACGLVLSAAIVVFGLLVVAHKS